MARFVSEAKKHDEMIFPPGITVNHPPRVMISEEAGMPEPPFNLTVGPEKVKAMADFVAAYAEELTGNYVRAFQESSDLEGRNQVTEHAANAFMSQCDLLFRDNIPGYGLSAEGKDPMIHALEAINWFLALKKRYFHMWLGDEDSHINLFDVTNRYTVNADGKDIGKMIELENGRMDYLRNVGGTVDMNGNMLYMKGYDVINGGMIEELKTGLEKRMTMEEIEEESKRNVMVHEAIHGYVRVRFAELHGKMDACTREESDAFSAVHEICAFGGQFADSNIHYGIIDLYRAREPVYETVSTILGYLLTRDILEDVNTGRFVLEEEYFGENGNLTIKIIRDYLDTKHSPEYVRKIGRELYQRGIHLMSQFAIQAKTPA